jgi:hypothetical protein
MIIRKHVVEVECLDYGSLIDRYWTLATSVDEGTPVLDGHEYRSVAVAVHERDLWLGKDWAHKPADVTVEAGPYIKRQSDLNPHGLV